jgi:phospholipase/carboxylesterase
VARDALTRRERPARGAAEATLLFLHGRAGDETSLEPLLTELDPDRRLHGITLRAPHDDAAGLAHWYALDDERGEPEPTTFAASLEALAGEALDWERTIVGGFSQGAVMAYALGLGAGRPSPLGVIALAGYLPADLDLGGHEGVRVAIAHGTGDTVIPIARARAARDRLQQAGLDVLYRETPQFHGIDAVTVHVLQNWIADALGDG